MDEITLTILETSDVHGNVFPINYGTNQHADVGLAKISTLIKQEKAKNEATLVLDNGDVIQGTPFTYHYARMNNNQENPMTLAMNQIGYEASVFGNHEFNYGRDLLDRTVQASQFPWLAANIVDDTTGEPFYGQPYIIKTFPSGLKVAVLGLTTQYIPNWEQQDHIQGMEFKDVVVTAKTWVPYIKEQETPDVMIISYHGGFERDLDTGEATEKLTGENQGYQLCQEVEGIDILLTGHQHRLIADQTINGVTVLQPGNNGIVLGKVIVDLAHDGDKWKIVDTQSQLLSTGGVNPDQTILETVTSYEQATQAWLDQPIGTIKGDMVVHDPLAIRLQDNPLIEFINQVQMDVAGVNISHTALFNNDSPGFPSHVTMRDVVSNYIYPNTLQVIRISGQDIKDALEQSATYFKQYNGSDIEINERFTTPKPQHYNYDMWEGIDYTIDIRRPEGERITQLDYQGAPVQMNETYDVVMNNYRAGGGGDYLMYKDKPVIKDIQTDMSELIANYILRHKEIEATVDGNWKVIY
ncbi:bifunctional metallophosphatase/5'-nucleotidase [Tuberibacillus sp. Marseille-P3662]|uniref:bifunctional metallophosphatase/5'-nucleotidase n=1 Tax=Tuberibacillus sp. Marseille-P3662 TaxID=1965358 RepID=UPI000A1C984C|nr:bifunctional UDP-sugar hydrolase/5'-nucleotidase [Tuberibacillus sp. Marseille-P3662]